MLRHRSEEALRRKARRGELFMTVAVGYERVGRDAIGMDPDRRVQEAIALVFRKFAEFGSIRQVHLWLRHEGIELPAVLLRTIAAQDGLEAAGLQRRSSRIDQPDLRRRLPARGESRRSERVGVDGGDRVPYTERAWRWARNRRCDRRRRCG